MKYFQWTDALRVNIEEIDLQHQELIKIVNDLAMAIKIGKGDDILNEILAQLKEYAIIHFATEERLLKGHGYPDLENHKKEHSEFKDYVLKLNGEFCTEKSFHPEHVANYLKNWITNHIQGTDRQYSSFLTNKGVR